jgi:hypothetical protein
MEDSPPTEEIKQELNQTPDPKSGASIDFSKSEEQTLGFSTINEDSPPDR